MSDLLQTVVLIEPSVDFFLKGIYLSNTFSYSVLFSPSNLVWLFVLWGVGKGPSGRVHCGWVMWGVCAPGPGLLLSLLVLGHSVVWDQFFASHCTYYVLWSRLLRYSPRMPGGGEGRPAAYLLICLFFYPSLRLNLLYEYHNWLAPAPFWYTLLFLYSVPHSAWDQCFAFHCAEYWLAFTLLTKNSP